MEPFISVVIPSHNRKQELERVLESLENQTYPDERYEIVVIDDSVPPIEVKESPKVKYFHIAPTGHTEARNIGVMRSRGEIISFTDDDCLPEKEWLEKISSHFCNPSISGVEGKTITEKMGVNFHATENLKGGNYPTCNLSFRRHVLESMGGFDEKYGFFREDTDLAFSVLENGGKIIFADNVVVFHPPRKIASHSPLRELKMIKSDIRLYKKFRRTYKNVIGMVGGGGVKTSGLVWMLSLLLVGGILFNLLMAVVAILLIVYVKHFAHLRNRTFDISGYVGYVAYSWLRDILYPFYFTFYYLTEDGH